MLWIALAGRDAGVRCSEMLGIERTTAALDFDLACAYRLVQYDIKRENERLKAFKEMVRAGTVEAYNGKKPDAENEPEDDPFSNISEDDVM